MRTGGRQGFSSGDCLSYPAVPSQRLSGIKIDFQGKTYRFPINQWLEGNSLQTYTAKNRFDRGSTYTVQIKTGDLTGAGTDANISMQIEGTRRDEDNPRSVKAVTIDKFILNGIMKGNVFERNQVDTVVLSHRPFIEDISKITLSSDDKYSGSAWYVEWIIITWPNAFGGTSTATFNTYAWLESGKLSATFKPSSTKSY